MWTADELQGNAQDFGWDPTWLDMPPDEWGPELEDAITERQTFWGLAPTGLVDEPTFRRLALEQTYLEPSLEPPPTSPSDCILIAGQRRPIAWDRVVTPDEDGGRGIEQYYHDSKGRRRRRYKERDVPLVAVRRATVHWTVTRSASHTWRYAWDAPRSVSTHWEINWDGTIYQLTDPVFQAFHMGVGTFNDLSVGIDLTNPVAANDTKRWNRRLLEVNQTPRPELSDWRINGWDPGTFLGPTDQQVRALQALAKGLEVHMGIPLVAALTTKPNRLQACKLQGLTSSQVQRAVPEGWVHHAEVLRGKWDHAGINLPVLLRGAGGR